MTQRKKAGATLDRAQDQPNAVSNLLVPARTSSGFGDRPPASPSKPTIAFVTPTNPDQAELDRPPYSEPPFDPPKTAWFDGQLVKRRRARRKGDR